MHMCYREKQISSIRILMDMYIYAIEAISGIHSNTF